MVSESPWKQCMVPDVRKERMVRGTAMPICTFEALTWKEKN